jgi:uncharacterized protein with PIN domain
VEQLAVRCYAELNDFLPSARRHRTFLVPWPGRASIKDTIEALGVPHPEIALILVNGEPVSFSYLVQPGDDIHIYPTRTALTMGQPLIQPLPPPRFVLDVHLGRLAELLRLLGFDTLYRNDYDDPQLASIASTQARILLTRDIGLLKRSSVTYGYFVRETEPQQQVIEIMRRFDVFDAITPFRRCSRCNGMLAPVNKGDIEALLPPETRREHDEFQRCTHCGQIYWPGSHYRKLQDFVACVRQHDPRMHSSPTDV